MALSMPASSGSSAAFLGDGKPVGVEGPYNDPWATNGETTSKMMLPSSLGQWPAKKSVKCVHWLGEPLGKSSPD